MLLPDFTWSYVVSLTKSRQGVRFLIAKDGRCRRLPLNSVELVYPVPESAFSLSQPPKNLCQLRISVQKFDS